VLACKDSSLSAANCCQGCQQEAATSCLANPCATHQLPGCHMSFLNRSAAHDNSLLAVVVGVPAAVANCPSPGSDLSDPVPATVVTVQPAENRSNTPSTNDKSVRQEFNEQQKQGFTSPGQHVGQASSTRQNISGQLCHSWPILPHLWMMLCCPRPQSA
jgi:hypothetical protein